MTTERFAPSPTGLLHLGHAYSAALGWLSARQNLGKFLLRMEDLDKGRCRPEFYDAIREDMIWLGLTWDREVLCQRERLQAYNVAIEKLQSLGVIYECACTRKDIQAAISAPQEGSGLDGLIYPGTCKALPTLSAPPHALRLDMQKAIALLINKFNASELSFQAVQESGAISTVHVSPASLQRNVGDVVLMRKDGAPAYHLTVVVDDAFQKITHVTRGSDLEAATPLHRLLQALLELPTPLYRHHRLIRDDRGKRLAKRDDARSIRTLRQNGAMASDVYQQLGLIDQVAEFLP